MQTKKATQRNARSGSEMAEIVRSTAVFRQLRHLGFKTIDLEVDSEFLSEGPSPFHELGFCTSGKLLLLVGSGFERVETFTIKPHDLFFVPAGTTYSIHNDDDNTSSLCLACARDGVDAQELPLVGGGRVLIHDASNGEEDLQAANPHIRTGSDGEEGYEVLFRDRSNVAARQNTVGDVFNRHVVAREFGIPEPRLPDMNFGFFDPLVLRPLALHGQEDLGL